jgi:hypothetical protein
MQHIMEQQFFMNATLTLNWMDMDEDFALKMVPGRLKLHNASVSPKTKSLKVQTLQLIGKYCCFRRF